MRVGASLPARSPSPSPLLSLLSSTSAPPTPPSPSPSAFPFLLWFRLRLSLPVPVPVPSPLRSTPAQAQPPCPCPCPFHSLFWSRLLQLPLPLPLSSPLRFTPPPLPFSATAPVPLPSPLHAHSLSLSPPPPPPFFLSPYRRHLHLPLARSFQSDQELPTPNLTGLNRCTPVLYPTLCLRPSLSVIHRLPATSLPLISLPHLSALFFRTTCWSKVGWRRSRRRTRIRWGFSMMQSMQAMGFIDAQLRNLCDR